MDAERMLASLVRSSMGGGSRRRRRRSSIMGVSKGALGMGALGVAIAAFEHFTKESPGENTPGSSSRQSPPLPPLPGGAAGALPDLPPLPVAPADAPAGANQDEALLVVRAMISAANADFEVDDAERQRIQQALDESGLGDQEKQFLLAEIERPAEISALAEAATTPALAREVYLGSLMAIDVDSQTEVDYLARLAGRLGLSDDQVSEIEGLIERGDPTD